MSVFSQDSIESLNKSIEANPGVAENYMKRYEFYKDIWEEDQNNLESAARGLADLSKYISLKPKDAEAYRIRAAMREALFLGANAYSIADYKKVLLLTPNDANIKKRLTKMQADYTKRYAAKDCKESRSKNGFQGHPADEPDTVLAMSLYAYSDEELDYKLALKNLGCGADAKYRYKQHNLIPEFGDLNGMHLIAVIAMLEAGASPNAADRLGNTVLMRTLEYFDNEKEAEIKDLQFKTTEKIKALLQYGANVNAKNRKGKSVMSFAKKLGNKEVIALLEKNRTR